MSRPFAMLYTTKSGNIYVYDPLTNRIISIDSTADPEKKEDFSEDVYSYLSEAGEIRNSHFSKICWQLSFDEYRKKVEFEIPVLLLEFTKRCSLRCRYCTVRTDDSSEPQCAEYDMCEETVYRSIDFYAAHNSKCPNARINFYGGEPFLRFDLLKKVVVYANDKFKDKPVSFGISTNGMHLNDDSMKWLLDNPKITVTITVNGPYHDLYRITPDGQGSLLTIMHNIAIMKTKYQQVWEKQVQFIANLDCESEIPDLLRFYRDYIGKRPVAVTGIRWQRDMAVRPYEPLLFSETEDPYLQDYYREAVWDIHHRVLWKEDFVFLNICFPCTVKLFVQADGQLSFCEKMGKYISIGDLDQGFDEEKMKRIYSGVQKLFNQTCLNCWARRLCCICLADLFDSEGHMPEQIPEEICINNRADILSHLVMYSEMMEHK